MPISLTEARQLLARHAGEEDPFVLAEQLGPVPAAERPIPPSVPLARDWSANARRQRLEFLRRRGVEVPHLAEEAGPVDPAALQGNIEQYIGMTQIPTGLVGPLRVNGLHANGDYYVPLATSEGTLVASYHRGARLATRAGGVACLTTVEHVQRAPGFAFTTLAEAALFAVWAQGRFESFQEAAGSRTRHGRLLDMLTHIEGNHVYLIFAFHTGDAAGQNMVTFCTAAICEEILSTTPVAPKFWFLESNMSGDKKASALSFLQTRGRNVKAETVLPRRLVERGLRTTPERMCDYWRMSFVGGVMSGSIGVSGHIANGLAALFLACGQDVACVAEASIGITRLELTDAGDLYCGLTLPNLIVGTVGGGTRLPTARECLAILDCQGEGTASRLAEICAALALAGEISIIGALCAGEFAQAHQRLGRVAGTPGPAEPAGSEEAA
jgi:hydroxymethylglutaryl-CoA reductase (NADPH)